MAQTKDNKPTTLEVMRDRERQPDDLVSPREMTESNLSLHNPPSVTALKVQMLMIKHVGGAIAEDRTHEISVSYIRKQLGGRNLTRADMRAILVELRGVTYEIIAPDEDEVGGIVEWGKVFPRTRSLDDQTEVPGELVMQWKFSSRFRDVMRLSTLWAVLDRQGLLAMRTVPSFRLYELISGLWKRQHKEKTYEIGDLRALLGATAKSYDRVAEFKRAVMQKALLEVNQVAPFTVKATWIREGNRYTKVRFTWATKEAAELAKADAEMEGASVGRKARREGKVEAIATSDPDTFPARSIRWTPWEAIARKHGGGWDVDRLAGAFRSWAEKQGVPLQGEGVEKRFIGFCKTFVEKNGRA